MLERVSLDALVIVFATAQSCPSSKVADANVERIRMLVPGLTGVTHDHGPVDNICCSQAAFRIPCLPPTELFDFDLLSDDILNKDGLWTVILAIKIAMTETTIPWFCYFLPGI